MKTLILIENLTTTLRLTLANETTSETDKNLFANLRWVCHERNYDIDSSSFCVTSKKLASAIKAFRSPKRYASKNQDKNAPFTFKVVPGFSGTGAKGFEEYKQGEYQDVKSPWEGYQSKLAKLMDTVES